MGGSSADDTGIVFDGDKLSLVIKNGPVLLEKGVNLVPDADFQMGQIQLLVQFCAMTFLVVCGMKFWTDIVKIGGGMLALTQYGAAVNVVQDDFKVM